MIQRTNTQSGFTLIELMLALAFVGFLLIFVVTATLEVMGDYNKGLALKSINQTARSVLEDMSSVARLTTAGTANLTALNNGRVCFGGVSYVWNIQGGNANKYTDGTSVTFARVQDSAGALCIASSGVYPNVSLSSATSLLTSNQVWVQAVGVSLSTDQQLVTLSINLSTSGNNQPTIASSNGPICAGGRANNFCATASFTTTVNARNLGG